MAHKDMARRLAKINRIHPLTRHDHRHLVDDNGNPPFLNELTRNERRKLAAKSKKIGRTYFKIHNQILRSGAGFPNDQLLRDMIIEYNHRYATSGVYNQPVSFNFFEPFCQLKLIESCAPFVEPVKEIDHVFNITDYIDYLTSIEVELYDLNALRELPENVTNHFTTNGDINEFSILTDTGNEFFISGFSMIRRGDSLFWFIIGGEVLSADQWELLNKNPTEINIEQLNPYKKEFIKDCLHKNSYNTVGKPLALEGTENAIKTVIAGELSLITKKFYSRCIMKDFENSFLMVTDNPDLDMVHWGAADEELFYNNMAEAINSAKPLWDITNAMFQLPAYLNYSLSVDAPLENNVFNNISKPRPLGGRGIEGCYKTIPSLFINKESLCIREFVPPHFHADTSGHWRRLEDGKTGKDQEGNPVDGRTWVAKPSEWREEINQTKTIYLKSTIQAARFKIAEYEQSGLLADNNEHAVSNLPSLYVMRCTAMEEEICKVGWTSLSSFERAKQLSSATGVPFTFKVVRSWQHECAEQLEKSVHAMLDPYRINDRREFFKVKLQSIEKIISQEINKIVDY